MEKLVIYLGLTSTVCGLIFGFSSYIASKTKESKTAGKDKGSILSELGYVKSGIDDIKRKQEHQEEKQEQQHLEIVERLTCVESSAKQAHKRLDKLERFQK